MPWFGHCVGLFTKLHKIHTSLCLTSAFFLGLPYSEVRLVCTFWLKYLKFKTKVYDVIINILITTLCIVKLRLSSLILGCYLYKTRSGREGSIEPMITLSF